MYSGDPMCVCANGTCELMIRPIPRSPSWQQTGSGPNQKHTSRPNLDDTSAKHKNIERFEIAVDDSFAMKVSDTLTDLQEYSPDALFAQIPEIRNERMTKARLSIENRRTS
jgi:hypothetical protein